MISYLWITVLGLAVLCDGGTVGSGTNNYIYSTKSLCDVIYSTKESVGSSLATAFGFGDVECHVQDECRGLQCFSVNKIGLNFRIDLNLCQVNNKTVDFSVESLNREKWSLNIPLFSNSYKSGRHKISFFREGFPQKIFFLKVSTAVNFRDKETTPLLTSSLQSCEDTESESSCVNFPLFILPYLHINVCDNIKTKYLTRNRSSRSVPVNPEDLHTRQPNLSPIPTSQIDRHCDFEIHSCGANAACRNNNGTGTCECLEGFAPDVNGTCINHPDDPLTPTPANHTNTSYSPVFGAIFAILILLGMAAAAYFGTKHQVFQRLRNRLPVSLRCWPFPVIRRSRPADDNVSLVYPIDDDGDDEPLLL